MNEACLFRTLQQVNYIEWTFIIKPAKIEKDITSKQKFN